MFNVDVDVDFDVDDDDDDVEIKYQKNVPYSAKNIVINNINATNDCINVELFNHRSSLYVVAKRNKI